MKPQCIARVNAIAGKELTQAKLDEIESGIKLAERQLALKDPAFRSASPQQRVLAAAEQSAKNMVAKTVGKQQAAVANITARVKMGAFVTNHPKSGYDAILDMVTERVARGQSVTPMESHLTAIRGYALGQLEELLQKDSRLMGLMADPVFQKEVIRAAWGDPNVRPDATRLATTFLKQTDEMSENLRNSGGKIGRLDDYRMPQVDDADILLQKGKTAWVDHHLSWVKRDVYYDDAGNPFNDAQMKSFLEHAYDSKVTNGANKRTPGERGRATSIGDRSDKSRQIHYKDADSQIAAIEEYSRRGVAEMMVGHIDGLAREIAAVQSFGPDSVANLQYAIDINEKRLIAEGRAADITKERSNLEHMVDMALGQTPGPVSPRIAQIGAHSRALGVAARLGRALFSSIPDEATLAVTAAANSIPLTQLWAREFQAILPNSELRRYMRRQGLALEGAIGEIQKYQDTYMLRGMPSRLATMVLKLSGLTLVTDARKAAFGMNMFDALGSVNDKFATMADAAAAGDAEILKFKGVTETDWKVWKLAKRDNYKGASLLSPQSVFDISDADLKAAGVTAQDRQIAGQKVLGITGDETNIAVVTAGMYERWRMENAVGRPQRGTPMGELALSALSFKSTSVAMWTRHMSRIWNDDTGAIGRGHYAAGLFVAATVAGMLAEQLYAMSDGKEPLDFDPTSKHGVANLGRAVLRGGAFGYLGDFIQSDTSGFGTNLVTALAGPGAGLVNSLAELTIGNARELAQGKTTHSGAEMIRLAKGFTPFANLWYTKAAMDRLVWNQAMDYVSPGYTGRVERRAQQELGQRYYWRPQDTAPGFMR